MKQSTIENIDHAKRLLKEKPHLSIKDVAKILGYKRSNFSQLFKQYTGQTPAQFRGVRTNPRLEHAKYLLQNSDQRIYKIAEALGYEPASFSLQFKKYTGQTPKKFRKNKLTPDFKKARDLMAESDFFLQEIAEKSNFFDAGVLTSIFEKTSKKAGELGIEEYRNHLKLWRAQRYLRRTDLTEEHVGHNIGFNDVAEFKQFFSSQVGILPTEYRQKAPSLSFKAA